MSFVRSIARLRKREETAHPEWVVVSLGNPGAQYARTRHNIGFMCANRLAQRAHTRFRHSSKDRADLATTSMAGVAVVVAQPQTYMNESGIAVRRLARHFDISPGRILVVYDDVDLPFGALRIREQGSAGGHKGMKSVIQELGTSDIPRIRVGIGRESGETRDYVLSQFSNGERRLLEPLCDRVAEVVQVVVTEGVTAAMNRFNGATVSEPASL